MGQLPFATFFNPPRATRLTTSDLIWRRTILGTACRSQLNNVPTGSSEFCDQS